MNNPPRIMDNLLRILDLEKLIANEDFKQIAYIQVLAFAVSKAKNVGFEHGATGFTIKDIKSYLEDERKIQITNDWLGSLLASICTIYRNKEEIKGRFFEPSQLAKTICRGNKESFNEYTFVIKADEYMRYVALDSLYKTEKSIRVGIITVIVTIVIGFFTYCGK